MERVNCGNRMIGKDEREVDELNELLLRSRVYPVAEDIGLNSLGR